MSAAENRRLAALLPAAGTYGKEKLGRLFNAMLGQLKSGLKIYNQHYSFVIEFRDGRISAVREYLDTQHAQQSGITYDKPRR